VLDGFKELKMNVILSKSSKGLSLIEVLVLFAALAVLLPFANPMFRDNSARSAIKEATVQVALALHNARNSARSSNSPVTVLISTNPSHNTLLFEYPKENSGGIVPSLPPVTLPTGISVSSDTAAVTFDPHGTVSTGGSIRLTSSSHTDFYATVLLKSPSGRVKTSYGLQGQDEDTDAS
jgi:Tfp pilus assembly protein FimT